MNQKLRLIVISLFAVWLLAACAPTSAPAADEGDVEPTRDTAVEEEMEPAETEEASEMDETAVPDEDTNEEEPMDPTQPTPADRSERLTPGAMPGSVDPVPQETAAPPVVEALPDAVMTSVMSTLQENAGITADATEVNLIRAEAVVWPDGSLGCPEPGVMYTQALVEGYWVVMEIDGETYDFRINDNGFAKLCNNALQAPLGGPIDQ